MVIEIKEKESKKKKRYQKEMKGKLFKRK